VAGERARLPPLHISGLLAHAETGFGPWVRFGRAVRHDLDLDPALRELASLVVGRLAAPYEWDQHVPIALAAGVRRGQIEAVLSRYMSRTERLGAAGQHDAMLHQIVRTPALQLTDVQQYLLIQAIADLLEQPDVTELWKSAPYLLNFLDGYKLRARFDADRAVPDYERELAAVIDAHAERLLDRSKLARYDDIDPGAPRLRALVEDLVDTEAWRLLWIPPALPYHELGGAYARPELEGLTKRLVFSAWRAVPRSVAGLLSYLAERRFTLEADPTAVNTPQRRAAQRDRLTFASGERGRLTGMPALAILYPSTTLAVAADPREFAREHSDRSMTELISWATSRIAPLLERLPAPSGDRKDDERWYWAAPLLLDAADHEFWELEDLAAAWTGWDSRAASEGSGWQEHVDLAAETAGGTLAPPLGTMPSDLADVLALMALGAPGVVAMRSLARVTGLGYEDVELRIAAGQVAWGLRSLFNSPEATALLRAARTETFWREVLRHSIDGDLQAVLDEYAHMLFESEGLLDQAPVDAAYLIAGAMMRALGLRASRAVIEGTIASLPAGSPLRGALRQVVSFANLAIEGLGFASPVLGSIGNPLSVEVTQLAGRTTPTDAYAASIAVVVSLMFVALLLAAGMLALERSENAYSRLVRGLLSRGGLLAEKITLSGACAAGVTLVMAALVSLFVHLDWTRFPLWVLALALTGLAFGALGVVIGSLAREVSVASLMAFLLSLPIAFVALVPGNAVSGALKSVLDAVSFVFPFKAGIEAVSNAFTGTAPGAAGPLAHLVVLTLVFAALARIAIRRFV